MTAPRPVIPPPAVWLEEVLTFCADGTLLTDRYATRVRCCYQCLGAAR